MSWEDWLRRAAAAQRVATERTLAALDVTPAQFATLRILAAEPGLSSADIARLEHLTPPTVSVIVANLERKKAIHRIRDAKSARIRRLALTDSGSDLLRNAEERLRELHARYSESVSPHALSAVRDWLRGVAEIEV